MSVEKVLEGKCIPNPKINAASVMVAYEMLENGFVPGKGFKTTAADIKRARKLKQRAWVLPNPVPHLSRSFVKSGMRSRLVTAIPSSMINPNKELIGIFEKLFDSFYCTNNMAEYEACILGLRLAAEMNVREVLVLGNSDLLVHQIQGEWEMRDMKLIPY
uniref:RNase H type-1 domain-containing protein n=1 Tax=Nicotiana tabacum TaxID=4097 RepID=A0A1S3XG65_TOBAC|nr:PREDICTED: uncharacterized protein LOC107764704 [Nicotiana tabacum]